MELPAVGQGYEWPPETRMSDQTTLPAGVTHGAARLPSVIVESYAVEMKDEAGFVGDRANKGAFQDLLEKWRKVARKGGKDPLGNKETGAIEKKELDKLLTEGDAAAAAVVQSAIEEFAQELATVIKRFLKLKAWATPSGWLSAEVSAGGGSASSRSREPACCSRLTISTSISR